VEKNTYIMTRRLLLSLSVLVIASRSLKHVEAQSAGEQEVARILESYEIVARGIRDEIKKGYSARCDDNTIESCAGSNYNDCSSNFPKPDCVTKEEVVSNSNCQCGCEW
jgi:hypothetical protein